jgi:hypothetical protein
MSSLSTYFQIHLLAEPAPGQLANETKMAIAFELFADRLQKFERLHFEMDGSFVWTGSTPAPWQLDGMAYDFAEQIQRIELKGQCSRVHWQMLLHALNHPQQSLVAYNLQSAQFATIPYLESTLWSS